MGYRRIFIVLMVLCLEDVLSINEAQMKAAVKLVRNTCRTKTKITDEQIGKMHEGIWDDDDEVTKCYTHCVLGMMKMRAKDGAFDRSLADLQIPQIPATIKEDLVASLDHCVGAGLYLVWANSGEGLTKKCDLSFAFFKCVYHYNPEKYIFP